MTEVITLSAETRDISGRKTEGLREQNIVPAVMYGFETSPITIQVNSGDFGRAYEKAGTSSIIQLEISGAAHPVLVQDVQYNPITDFVAHVDFRRINMNEKVQTSIAIVLHGVAPAVKDLGGVLVQNIEEVEVEALPSALVRELVLDISSLVSFDNMLHVSDIVVPEGITILTDVNETIAVVQEPETDHPHETPETQTAEAEKKEETTTDKK